MTTTLLAVDDSKTMRKVMEITFAGEGFKTVVAADAADAVAKAQAERPQVALIDAGLEGTNGYDLCKQIKGASPSTVVVLLSNKAQPYDKARGAAAGADDFMDKPFDTQQMIDKVILLAKRGAQAPAPAPAPAPSPYAAPAPVVAVPLAAKPPEAQRQRVQTLAYGSTPVPPQAVAAAPVVPAKPIASSSPFGSRAPTTPGTPAFAPPAPATAPPAAAVGNGAHAEFASKLGGLGLTQAQIEGVLALSREVVEKVVWEVVPTLAEAMIKEEITRLTRD
ncbi:MAG: Response regulator [Polyangiaceae bacterium]|nr:Response regulator [Polyangiaceae bacterium]